MNEFPAAGDLQALLFGHLRRPVSRHLLFRFDAADGGRRLLAALADGVVTMGDSANVPLPEPLTSLGLTRFGLRALELPDEVLDEFDPRFLDGVASKRLGDHPDTPSAIEHWWEQRFSTEDVHCVVHVHALDFGQLDARTAELLELAGQCDVTELIPRADGSRLDGAFMAGPGKLHFGYTDGISAPHVAWDHEPDPEHEIDFRNFVLGYATPEHHSLPDSGPAAELARGSTYGVFRWVHQDVATFNRFLREEGPKLFPDLAPEDAEELLAAKLMGRWRDGTPLVRSPHAPDPEYATSDGFTFEQDDPEGRLCPFAAHIRVMNPRDQPLKEYVLEVPPVLRRGTPYGPPLEGTEDDGVDRGLIGVFLCSDIMRQILTLTMWAQKTDFAPAYKGATRAQDALIGNRVTRDQRFVVPGAGEVESLPAFLTTKGTALALYPGRATLAALSRSPA